MDVRESSRGISTADSGMSIQLHLIFDKKITISRMSKYCYITRLLVNSLSCAMALVDSKAAFEQHCDKIDDSGALKAMLTGENLTTYSQLWFAIGSPQKPPTDDEFVEFGRALNNGVDLTIAALANLKRIHFESLTIVIANTKSRAIGDTGAEIVRKIPLAEKQARHVAQQPRLSGVQISGETQPSHALLDLVANMIETNFVVWVAPSRCTKRERARCNTLEKRNRRLCQ